MRVKVPKFPQHAAKLNKDNSPVMREAPVDKRMDAQALRKRAMEMQQGNMIQNIDMRNIFYEAGDPRRRNERLDSNLVHEDERAIANLPQQEYQTMFRGRRHQKMMNMDS